MKPYAYDTGFLIGRFQHFHLGHECLVDTLQLLCKRIIIFVGSSQESGTLRNPFNVSTRIAIIKEIYGDSVEVYGLSDMTTEDDVCYEWGDYLFNHFYQIYSKYPDVMCYGNDEARSHWCRPEMIKKTLEIIVPRGIVTDISATKLRRFIVDDDRVQWMANTNPLLHSRYPDIRSELMSVPDYRNMK